MTDKTIQRIALTMIPDVGDVIAKKLVAYCGGVEAVFSEKQSALKKIPQIGEKLAQAIAKANVMREAEEECRKIEKLGIRPLFFLDDDFPARLKHADDGPVLIYTLGNMNLNAEKAISIVGTRKATAHGKAFTEKLLDGLKHLDLLVVSGLAYGIDIEAHRNSVKKGLQTVAGLAHGLDRIYPDVHRNTAKEMLKNGGLVTDFRLGTKPDRHNFPARNRVVAGLSDATIVVESSEKGGSLITADIASSYHRDVFAVPGRPSDERSVGCNQLINRNKAALLNSADDLIRMMNWDVVAKPKAAQAKLLIELTADQEKLVGLLREGDCRVDEISLKAEMPMSAVASELLQLEFEGVVRSLPGKVYTLN